jgi:hypothetical protein
MLGTVFRVHAVFVGSHRKNYEGFSLAVVRMMSLIFKSTWTFYEKIPEIIDVYRLLPSFA